MDRSIVYCKGNNMDTTADTQHPAERDERKAHGDEPVEIAADQMGQVAGGAEGLATAYPE